MKIYSRESSRKRFLRLKILVLNIFVNNFFRYIWIHMDIVFSTPYKYNLKIRKSESSAKDPRKSWLIGMTSLSFDREKESKISKYISLRKIGNYYHMFSAKFREILFQIYGCREKKFLHRENFAKEMAKGKTE